MKTHVAVYFDHYGYDCQEDILCEKCGMQAVDIHHKTEKSICDKYGIEKTELTTL